MVMVTDNAKELLKRTLREHSNDPDTGLRLSMAPAGQFGVKLDREAEGDQVVEYEGTKVLLVAVELAPLMEEAIIDTRDTDNGPRLSLHKKTSDK